MSHLPCAQILQYEKLNETFSAAALQYLMTDFKGVFRLMTDFKGVFRLMTDFKGVFRLTASMRILAIMPSCESRVTCHNSFFDMVCH
jgi:hypothetical protein